MLDTIERLNSAIAQLEEAIADYKAEAAEEAIRVENIRKNADEYAAEKKKEADDYLFQVQDSLRNIVTMFNGFGKEYKALTSLIGGAPIKTSAEEPEPAEEMPVEEQKPEASVEGIINEVQKSSKPAEVKEGPKLTAEEKEKVAKIEETLSKSPNEAAAEQAVAETKASLRKEEVKQPEVADAVLEKIKVIEDADEKSEKSKAEKAAK